MSLIKMASKTSKVQQKLKQFIQDNFPNRRIICLIAYGSSLSQKFTPEDYDFLLLLDTYKTTDYKILKMASENLDLNLDLFIDYLDQIQKKGFNNYQRGRHGTYFFVNLANAKCLIGQNYYAKHVKKISDKSVQHDLLYRIEEYFYRIQKLYINSSLDQDSINIVKKYFSRICMDLLLFTKDLSFSNVNQTHYMDIINTKINKSNLFDKSTQKLLKKFFNTGNPNLVLEIISPLYKIYLNCYK